MKQQNPAAAVRGNEIIFADLKGLTPAIDPRKQGQPMVLSGRNFKFDSNGPKSDFGNELLSGFPLPSGDFAQGIYIETRNGPVTLTFSSDGIFEWDEGLGDFRVIYTGEDMTLFPYRWTSGYLNDFIYLCHPRAGVLQYDVRTRLLTKLTNLPIGRPKACCVDNGRLVIVDDYFFYWSAQSDGSNFTPALGGAGSQKIQDRTPGEVITVASYGQGTLTFCTGGIMRSSFTGANEVYRHRNIDTDQQPINSFCVQRIGENKILFLDRRGFRTSDGNLPKPFAPLFNEYVKHLLRSAYLLDASNIRFDWDKISEQIFLSLSASDVTPLYSRAYVLYTPLDRWGSFDELQYGFLPIRITAGSREGKHFGFVGADKRVRIFTLRGYREERTDDTTANLYRPKASLPSRADDTSDSWLMASTCHPNSVNEAASQAMVPSAGIAGYYTYDGGGKIPSNNLGLDSLVRIGLFRLRDGSSVDQVSELLDVVVGSARSRDSSLDSSADWNLSGTDADWNTAGQLVDYGDRVLDTIHFDINIVSTNDGRSAFASEVPTLSHFSEGQKFYTCSVVGVWFMIELSAVTPGDYFQAKYIAVDGILAGRLL